MSSVSKFFGLVLIGSMGFISITALGATPGSTDSIYTESVSLQRSSAEIPGSIDSGKAPSDLDESDYVIESMNDLEGAPAPAPAPANKKISSAKTKRSIKN